MRLKSLDIVGFKSFADPFRIDFRQGISSIVGPNGCGKSNVADAIRWVLGTQSPKQLRAERMESVIFSGSTRRKQLGMAEVTLTFDNSDRSLDLDYDEVSVSRRLFRSGDSEYSINGARCRLMDITDLVVDRGLGSTGYWILESKMVGTILSNRPEDRRFLFDEAAGIVKYKIQRHRAELKLNSAASDLERLADIISEVESTCRGLKRQVSSFRKHEKVTEDIRYLREAMTLIESVQLRKQLEERNSLLEETGARVGDLSASLSSKSAVLSKIKTEFTMVQGKLDDAHRKCADLDSALAENDRETAVSEQKIDSLQTRISENTSRIARERERVQIYRNDIQNLQDEKLSLDPSTGEIEKEKEKCLKEQEEYIGKVAQAKQTLEDIRTRRLSLDEQLDQLRLERLESIKQEEARKQRAAWLEKSSLELKATLEKTTFEIRQIRNDIDVCRDKIAEAQHKKQKLHQELSTLKEQSAELRLKNLESSEQIAVLREKGRRCEEILNGASCENSLSSSLKPAAGMGKALGAFLMGFNSASAMQNLDGFEDSADGYYAVSPVFSHSNLPEGAVPLAQCVQSCEDSVLNSILQCGVLAPDRSTAMEWIQGGISCPVVTTGGDLFRPEGLVRLGVETETAGPLELQQLLKEHRDLLDDQLSHSTELKNTMGKLADQENRLSESIQKHQNDLQQTSSLLAARESLLGKASASGESIQQQINAVEAELAELAQISHGEGLDSSSDRLESLEKERKECQEQDKKYTSQLSELEAVLSQTIRKSDSILFRLREITSRRVEIDKRITMLTQEENRLQELLDELSSNSVQSSKSIDSLKAEVQKLREKREKLALDRGRAETVRTEHSASRNSLMEKSAVLEKEVQQIRESLGKAKSKMIELEAASRSLVEKLDLLEKDVSPGENPYLSLSPGELTEKLSAQQRNLEAIGPVNMLAVHEYNETSGRLDYLREQRDDLEEARASLARAITEINEEAAQRFRETFEQVRGHFKEMFIRLFGGGEGDIVSVEGDDPLEGGIEIMARPRGKKLKNVIALSEGEKAMTAVALLFSLYLVKPSPFCVLDELDGPFDDSNTDKFVAILRDFSMDTQFIVITHNKRTMEGSDVLYGITMAEEGVSTITSVSLEEMVKRN